MASDERDPGDVEARLAPAPQPGLDRGDRVHAFHAPGITVTWSRRRCIHAADCVMNLPTVFEPGRRPWVDATQASADAVARVVARCPTGSLHFERRDGGSPEPTPTANTVLVSRNGPTYVRGDIEVTDERGDVRLLDTRVALCRCGLSKNKPLCDNAHLEAGFREGGAITAPDAESRVEDPGAESTRLRVMVRENGPLELVGPFAISGSDRKTMLAGTRTKLCRCGESGAKPFCDGTHKRVGFLSD
jgi:CDGSH-type Zn-finger protein/uncharacterized Fe-S cluster protein YjdI